MTSTETPILDLATLGVVVLIAFSLALGLAALALHLDAERSDKRRARRQARWEPLLLAALMGERNPSSLHLLVRPLERLAFLRFLVSYALRLDGESRECLCVVAAPLLGKGARLLTHRRPDQRALGVHLLGLLGSVNDRALILPLLNDPSPGVAMTTARALARPENAAYSPLVIAAIERFQTWDLASLSSMLVRFGLSARPWLEGTLADPSRSETARAACAEALRRLGSTPSATIAADLLSAETLPPREVCTAALRLLRDAGGPSQASVVRTLCESDDEIIRLHAVSALSTISLRPDDAARIEHALSDASPWVARRAARGLVESGRTSSLRVLADGTDARALLAQQALAEAGLI